MRNRGQISVLTRQLCLQPRMHRWHLGWKAIFPCALRKKSQSLFPFKFSPPVLFFRAVYPLLFGGFSPCVRLFRGGWDTYPTPEEKTAHRGDSGFCCFSQWWVVCVLQVYFQLQNGISQVPQRLFDFAFSSTAEAEKLFATPAQLQRNCCCKRKTLSVPTGFPVLQHLQHFRKH